MSRRNLAVIDAETMPIRSRPEYPPKAVGYAVKFGRTHRYLSFGHPTGNNCDRREAIALLKDLSRDYDLIFHNSEFDIEVMRRDGVRVSGAYHDTLKLAFLNEPRALDLGLKPQAAQYLEDPPDERDVLKEWIMENIKPKRKKEWGDYICEAPGDLVGVYAKGDARKTAGLYRYFTKTVFARGMEEAYRREMRLVPVKLHMERGGIRVRLTKLKRDAVGFRRLHEKLNRQIRRRLGVGEDFNLGSSKQLADALIERDLLSSVVTTAKGNVSTKRSVLEENCTDRKLTEMLSVHGVLSTYLSTFISNWIERAEQNDGYVHPTFNTTRSADEYGGGRDFGTRTGRFSSSNPNFQNIPNNIEDSPSAATLKLLAKWLAKEGVQFVGMRDYFAPDEGHVFIGRDYNQQELRILAHFEEGAFMRVYLSDPRADAHDAVRELVLSAMGIDFPRKHVKITNFGIIYGQGVPKLSARLDVDVHTARTLKRAILDAVPGIKQMMREFRKLAKSGEPFYTWGGREYYCEEPRYVELGDGRKEKRTYEYKMLNTRIQGSAADCTKEGTINVYDSMGRESRIVLQVHDELLMSVPKAHAKREMIRMRDGMEDVKFNVPMLTDGKIGGVSWARMRSDKKSDKL
jgi:DNA polymerase I